MQPTDEDNTKYNSILATIEDSSDDAPRAMEGVCEALKMIWACIGGEVEETPLEKERRIRAARWAAEVLAASHHANALRGLITSVDGRTVKGSELSVRIISQRQVEVYQASTGIIVAGWWPKDQQTTMGGRQGPRCATAADVCNWLQSV